jgi:hypothetical protein
MLMKEKTSEIYKMSLIDDISTHMRGTGEYICLTTDV